MKNDDIQNNGEDVNAENVSWNLRKMCFRVKQISDNFCFVLMLKFHMTWMKFEDSAR